MLWKTHVLLSNTNRKQQPAEIGLTNKNSTFSNDNISVQKRPNFTVLVCYFCLQHFRHAYLHKRNWMRVVLCVINFRPLLTGGWGYASAHFSMCKVIHDITFEHAERSCFHIWNSQSHNQKAIQCCSDTLTMAGSCGSPPKDWALGGSQTWRSLISLPRKMMYSKISSRGGTGRSVGRSSVPKERTETTKHGLVYKGHNHYD